MEITASEESDNSMEVLPEGEFGASEKRRTSFSSAQRDPASAMALATSTKLASIPAPPSNKSASIPEEIDLEIALLGTSRTENASENTPLLGRMSASSSLSESRRKDSST
jgi:hypothetical protein